MDIPLFLSASASSRAPSRTRSARSDGAQDGRDARPYSLLVKFLNPYARRARPAVSSREPGARARVLISFGWNTRVRLVRGGAGALLAKSQRLDELLVTVAVDPAQVTEQPVPLPHEHEETAPGRVVFPVSLQVFGDAPDALGQDRDLHLRRAGVFLVCAEARDELLALVRRDHP